MTVSSHPWEPRILVAYTWFGLRLPIPSRWERPCRNRLDWQLWGYARRFGIIRLRYWGRA